MRRSDNMEKTFVDGFCMILGEKCYKECPHYYHRETNGCWREKYMVTEGRKRIGFLSRVCPNCSFGKDGMSGVEPFNWSYFDREIKKNVKKGMMWRFVRCKNCGAVFEETWEFKSWKFVRIDKGKKKRWKFWKR